MENTAKLFVTSSSKLNRVNEELVGAQGTPSYILEGVFAELGVMNVNHRIYTENEYLKHLQYIRDDVKAGTLLGELDHPDDRFETKLHEASHRIIDIWYEPETKLVKGKIELLTTPNGMLARSIVDMGIPLHISSRAAGTINKDNTVSIQQIYTYDLVAKPGFAKAQLHRVNESADSNENKYDEKIKSFLEKTETREDKNTAEVNMINEGFYTDATPCSVNGFRKEVTAIMENKDNEIDMNDVVKPITESGLQPTQAQEDNSAAAAQAAGVPTVDLSNVGNTANESDDNGDGDADGNKKGGEGSEKGKEGDSDATKDGDGKKDGDKDKDSKSDDKDGIISIRIVDKDELEEINKKQEDGDGSSDEKKKSDDSTDDGSEGDGKKDDDSNSNGDSGKEGEGDKTDEGADGEGKQEKEAKDANKLFDKKSEVDAKRNDFLGEIDKKLESVKKKNAVTESMRTEMAVKFPFSTYLNESDFAEFYELSDKQKNKVRDYLCTNSVVEPAEISNQWKKGLFESCEPVWLKYATPEYRELYENATEAEKTLVNESAKFLVFNTKSDVYTFWENSGLKSRQEKKMLNEAYIAAVPNIVHEEPKDNYPTKEAVEKWAKAYAEANY